MELVHDRSLGRMCCGALLAIGALVTGCSDDGDGSYPFGADAGQVTTHGQVTSGDTSGQGSGSTGGGSPTSGTNGGGGSESTMGVDGPADSETTAGVDASDDPDTAGDGSESVGSTRGDGGPTTGDATDSTTDDGAMGNPGSQPGIGMYSECSMFDACPPLVDPICLSTGPVFGFCTVACNASNECDAPPGDTTTAVCDAGTGYCMLDCSAGACPTGLDCVTGDLGAGMVSRCLEQ